VAAIENSTSPVFPSLQPIRSLFAGNFRERARVIWNGPPSTRAVRILEEMAITAQEFVESVDEVVTNLVINAL
jgi:hypothetical protein